MYSSLFVFLVTVLRKYDPNQTNNTEAVLFSWIKNIVCSRIWTHDFLVTLTTPQPIGVYVGVFGPLDLALSWSHFQSW